MEPEYQSSEGRSFWSSFGNKLIELIEFIAIIGAILVVVRFFVAEPHKVSGHSMVPNFQDGDYIITNKLVTRLDNLQRGKVIILQNPRNKDQVFIKRIVGLPLEQVSLQGGQVYINNKLFSEPYLPPGTLTPGESFLTEGESITIPEDQYFVMGDNRGASSDSREWGPISKDLIIGDAWLRYWPVQKFTLIKKDTPSR